MNFNKDFVRTVVLSFFLILLFRLVLPNGDEPDYHVRLSGLVNSDVFSPVSWLYDNLSLNVIYKPACTVISSVYSFAGSISGAECFLSKEDYFVRSFSHLLSALFIFSGVLIFEIYRFRIRKFYCPSDPLVRDSILVSLLFPGYLYFLGLASIESLTLILSTFTVLFIRSTVLVLFFFLSVFYIDVGNSIVLLFFIMSYTLFFWCAKTFKRISVYLIFSLGLVIVLSLGTKVILFFSVLPSPIGNKAISIYNVLTIGGQADLVSKYPAFFRPVYTFTTLVLHTPSYLSSIASFGLIGSVSFILFFKRKSLKSLFSSNRILALFMAAFSTIIYVTAILPTYAYGKYYAFLIPIFILPFVRVFGFKKSSLFSVVISVCSVINFGFFWL